MRMERCNGGEPNNDFLLPFYDWDELTKEQKREVRMSLGKWMGTDVVNYRFGKGFCYGQHYWFAHPRTADDVDNTMSALPTQENNNCPTQG